MNPNGIALATSGVGLVVAVVLWAGPGMVLSGLAAALGSALLGASVVLGVRRS